jgi:Tfp pilus assembly protein PilN
MIKINLAHRKRSAAMGAGPSNISLKSLDMANVLERLSVLKELKIQQILIPVAIGFAAYYGLDYYEAGEIAKLDAEIASINSERPALEAEIAKKKDYDALKKSMEDDEKVMRQKLDTIQKLTKGRTELAQTMIELAKATPVTIWITQFTVKNADSKPVLNIKGIANAINQIPDYERTLDSNPFFQGLKAHPRSTLDIAGREVHPFDLFAEGTQ